MSGKPETIEGQYARTNILTFMASKGYGAPPCPPSPPHPTPTEIVPAFRIPPFRYNVGRIDAWGTWMNWCPVEAHLWTTLRAEPIQGGDGITACPDHDGWPCAESEEVGQ